VPRPARPSTGKLKVFKLMKVAAPTGAEIRRTRCCSGIYGTRLAKRRSRKAYLRMIEEGRSAITGGWHANASFHLQAGSTRMVFWHPRGLGDLEQVEQYMRRVYRDHGYLEVPLPRSSTAICGRNPVMGKLQGAEFTTESEKRDYAINHELSRPRADLQQGPARYREFRCAMASSCVCTRNEPRALCTASCASELSPRRTATLFCTEERSSRSHGVHDLAARGLRRLRFHRGRLQTRDAPSETGRRRRAWGQSRTRASGIAPFERSRLRSASGEGAFYGPQDRIPSERQQSSLLAVRHHAGRFLLPGLLGAELRRRGQHAQGAGDAAPAIVGSMERFIGILIEHYRGRHAAVLAPVQVMVLNISEARPITPRGSRPL